MSTLPTELNIPPELIIDILSYLPVKTLCRFKCVSKSWMTLINHPRFIKRHQAHPRKQQLLVFNAHLNLVDLETSLKPKSFRESKVCPVRLDRLKENPNKRCLDVFYGSCNGLFYVRSDLDDFFFIYNPSTRESLKISAGLENVIPANAGFNDVMPCNAEFNAEVYYGAFKSFYGFGYVESIDDYRFVRVLSRKFLLLYSLRKRMWTLEVENFDFDLPTIRGGVSLNGAIHWGGIVSFHDNSGVITVFDLAKLKFKTLPLPIIPNCPHHCECNIYAVGEYLCLTFATYSGFWIMKEYGVQESWTRIIVSHNPFCQYVPLCLWDNDGIILSSDFNKRIFCYDKDGKVRKEFIFNREYRILPYVESLVSPNYGYSSENNMDIIITQENLGRFII